jgi:hypothetical protein
VDGIVGDVDGGLVLAGLGRGSATVAGSAGALPLRFRIDMDFPWDKPVRLAPQSGMSSIPGYFDRTRVWPGALGHLSDPKQFIGCHLFDGLRRADSTRTGRPPVCWR